MTNLKLITTENFGDLYCNFYRNVSDDILLTREQIGTALEYSNPDDALSKIHRRHKDRLDALSVVANLASTDGKIYSTTLYSQRGVMEICRWSRQQKANEFMDWVWDIVERYRSGELHNQVESKILSQVVDALSNINERLSNIVDKGQQSQSPQQSAQQQQITAPYKKPYNPWFSRMQPKYKLLEDYFDITRGQLYKNLLLELENKYGVDTHQTQADYCYENNLTSCYPLEPYEFSAKYREMIESIVNNCLVDLDIVDKYDPIVSTKHITIFNSNGF